MEAESKTKLHHQDGENDTKSGVNKNGSIIPQPIEIEHLY